MRSWVLAVVACLPGVLSAAENWPNWRGPHRDSVAAPGEYPTAWGANSNILWKYPLPGRGASTPIVWNGRVYLTYGKEGQNRLACLDLATQKLVWELALGTERSGKNKKASGSNPSPVTDGKSIFAYFKSGDLACVDPRGMVLWQKNLQQLYGEGTLWWDLGTSPVLAHGCVVVAIMHSGPSYVVAFERASGQEVWKVLRDVPAPQEAAQSYSTPLVADEPDGTQTIYVLGADHVTAHRGSDGQEVWRLGGLNPKQDGYFRSIASPAICGDLLIAPYARGRTTTAIRLGGKGDVTASHIAWFKSDLGADVPTPVAHEGRVYFCTDRGEVACLEGATGKVHWRQFVERGNFAYSSSPIIAGGHLYVTREDATTFVLKTGDKFELVAKNEFPGENSVATPVFVDGRLLLRTYEHLYWIGK